MSSSTAGQSAAGEASKQCTRCNETKPISEFPDIRRRGRLAKHSWCRPCLNEYLREQYRKHKPKRDAAAKAWRRAHPERVRELARAADARWRAQQGPDALPLNTYRSWVARLAKQGLTPDDYDRILAEQGGGCAICRATDPGKAGRGAPGKFPADHCHKTGRSRGLLCHRCNRGLGFFSDDPGLLRAAAQYLER